MNFNLISPATNGNDFTINFKDPIKIGENSKLQLNWVELKRKEVEQSLGISLEYCAGQYIELAKLSRQKKDHNTAKQCIDSLAKLMDYFPKEKVQRTENKVQFELLLKQLDQVPEIKELNPLVSDVQT